MSKTAIYYTPKLETSPAFYDLRAIKNLMEDAYDDNLFQPKNQTFSSLPAHYHLYLVGTHYSTLALDEQTKTLAAHADMIINLMCDYDYKPNSDYLKLLKTFNYKTITVWNADSDLVNSDKAAVAFYDRLTKRFGIRTRIHFNNWEIGTTRSFKDFINQFKPMHSELPKQQWESIYWGYPKKAVDLDFNKLGSGVIKNLLTTTDVKYGWPTFKIEKFDWINAAHEGKFKQILLPQDGLKSRYTFTRRLLEANWASRVSGGAKILQIGEGARFDWNDDYFYEQGAYMRDIIFREATAIAAYKR